MGHEQKYQSQVCFEYSQPHNYMLPLSDTLISNSRAIQYRNRAVDLHFPLSLFPALWCIGYFGTNRAAPRQIGCLNIAAAAVFRCMALAVPRRIGCMALAAAPQQMGMRDSQALRMQQQR